ncbi:hypothetical protein AVEN_51298-1 [Araneus ventricosus]|uniref:Uncharacterized protein n=1 Tax=Araneus ventricosus TaxID=182803 RepID=A0A4Y2RLE3_ARAVE|nr:hypothetical protein AVEN_51298-1 [Araneus ventricosus]
MCLLKAEGKELHRYESQKAFSNFRGNLMIYLYLPILLCLKTLDTPPPKPARGPTFLGVFHAHSHVSPPLFPPSCVPQLNSRIHLSEIGRFFRRDGHSQKARSLAEQEVLFFGKDRCLAPSPLNRPGPSPDDRQPCLRKITR